MMKKQGKNGDNGVSSDKKELKKGLPQSVWNDYEAKRRKKFNQVLESIRLELPIVENGSKVTVLKDALAYIQSLKKKQLNSSSLNYDVTKEKLDDCSKQLSILKKRLAFILFVLQDTGILSHLDETKQQIKLTVPVIKVKGNCQYFVKEEYVYNDEVGTSSESIISVSKCDTSTQVVSNEKLVVNNSEGEAVEQEELHTSSENVDKCASSESDKDGLILADQSVELTRGIGEHIIAQLTDSHITVLTPSLSHDPIMSTGVTPIYPNPRVIHINPASVVYVPNSSILGMSANPKKLKKIAPKPSFVSNDIGTRVTEESEDKCARRKLQYSVCKEKKKSKSSPSKQPSDIASTLSMQQLVSSAFRSVVPALEELEPTDAVSPQSTSVQSFFTSTNDKEILCKNPSVSQQDASQNLPEGMLDKSIKAATSNYSIMSLCISSNNEKVMEPSASNLVTVHSSGSNTSVTESDKKTTSVTLSPIITSSQSTLRVSSLIENVTTVATCPQKTSTVTSTLSKSISLVSNASILTPSIADSSILSTQEINTSTESSMPKPASLSIFSLAPITSFSHPFPFCPLSLTDAPTTFSFTLTSPVTTNASKHLSPQSIDGANKPNTTEPISIVSKDFVWSSNVCPSVTSCNLNSITKVVSSCTTVPHFTQSVISCGSANSISFKVKNVSESKSLSVTSLSNVSLLNTSPLNKLDSDGNSIMSHIGTPVSRNPTELIDPYASETTTTTDGSISSKTMEMSSYKLATSVPTAANDSPTISVTQSTTLNPVLALTETSDMESPEVVSSSPCKISTSIVSNCLTPKDVSSNYKSYTNIELPVSLNESCNTELPKRRLKSTQPVDNVNSSNAVSCVEETQKNSAEKDVQNAVLTSSSKPTGNVETQSSSCPSLVTLAVSKSSCPMSKKMIENMSDNCLESSGRTFSQPSNRFESSPKSTSGDVNLVTKTVPGVPFELKSFLTHPESVEPDKRNDHCKTVIVIPEEQMSKSVRGLEQSNSTKSNQISVMNIVNKETISMDSELKTDNKVICMKSPQKINRNTSNESYQSYSSCSSQPVQLKNTNYSCASFSNNNNNAGKGNLCEIFTNKDKSSFVHISSESRSLGNSLSLDNKHAREVQDPNRAQQMSSDLSSKNNFESNEPFGPINRDNYGVSGDNTREQISMKGHQRMSNAVYPQSFDNGPYNRKASCSPRGDNRQLCQTHCKNVNTYSTDMTSCSSNVSGMFPLSEQPGIQMRDNYIAESSRMFSVSHLVNRPYDSRKSVQVAPVSLKNVINNSVDDKRKDVAKSKGTTSRKMDPKSKTANAKNSNVETRHRSPARSVSTGQSASFSDAWNTKQGTHPKHSYSYTAEALISTPNYGRSNHRQPMHQNYHFMPSHNQMYQGAYSSQQLKNFSQSPAISYPNHDRGIASGCTNEYNFQLHPQTAYGSNMPYMHSGYPYQNIAPPGSASVLPSDIMPPAPSYSRLHDIVPDQSNFATNHPFPFSFDSQDMGTARQDGSNGPSTVSSDNSCGVTSASPVYYRGNINPKNNANLSMAIPSSYQSSANGKRIRIDDSLSVNSALGSSTNNFLDAGFSHISLHSLTPPCDEPNLNHSNILSAPPRQQNSFFLGSENIIPLNGNVQYGSISSMGPNINNLSVVDSSVGSIDSVHQDTVGVEKSTASSLNGSFDSYRPMERQHIGSGSMTLPHMSSSYSNFNVTSLIPNIDGKNAEDHQRIGPGSAMNQANIGAMPTRNNRKSECLSFELIN